MDRGESDQQTDRQTKCQGQKDCSKISRPLSACGSPQGLWSDPHSQHHAGREGLSLLQPQHPELTWAQSQGLVSTAECVSRSIKSEAQGRNRTVETLAQGPVSPDHWL